MIYSPQMPVQANRLVMAYRDEEAQLVLEELPPTSVGNTRQE